MCWCPLVMASTSLNHYTLSISQQSDHPPTMKQTPPAISGLLAFGLAMSVAQAGPQGTILVRELDAVTIDGDLSDWPIENFETTLELPPTPEALEAETVDVQGDHLVFNIDQVGFFNGTEAAHLSDGGEGDFGASTYFAYDSEFFYILNVVTDESVRGDRDMSDEGNQGFLNDGFEFFFDAAGDSDDCVAMGATFEDEDPNRDDMQITVALNDNFLPEGADADQLGVRQGLERGGNPLLVNSDGGTKNGPGGLFRDALDALDFPNIAARKTDDGYVIEQRIPFGFIPEFTSDNVMKYTQFWNDFDTDDGPGGANKSWITWGQQSTVTCEADEDPPAALFHAGTWAALEFVTDNPLNNKPGPNISLRTKVNFGQLDIPPTVQELTIPVRNTGITNPLAITDVTVSGTHGDRFTVVSFPNSLDAKAGGDIVLNFDSQGITGPYEAVLEVTNDDAEPEDQTRQVAISLSVVDPAGPLTHLKLDEPDGTVLADSSGNGRGGRLEPGGGNATLNQNPLAGGKAIEVSGGGSARLEGKPFGLLDSFSVSLWFQVADVAGQGTLVSRGAGGAPIFAVLQSGANASFFVNDGPIFATEGDLIQAGTAHHLVATYDNTEGVRRAAIFIDGVEAGSFDDPTVLDDFEEDPFWLGSFAQALGFSGLIDDFQYYNRILTAEEVQTLKDNPGKALSGVTPGEGGDGAVVVDLDASGLPEGAIATWENAGDLGGSFQAFGDPTVEVIAGVTGVTLDGNGDYLEGPVSTPAIEGDSPRSIIAWIYNPELASEETVISWGKRGGPDGTNMSFNHGFHNNFGAVGHWGGGGPDIGWNPDSMVEDEDPGVPGDAQAGVWTHISYTQTGSFTKVFTNGVLSNSEDAALNTHPGLGILVGAQREDNGVDVTDPLKGSLTVANVRVFDSALSDEDILADYETSAPGFAPPPVRDPVDILLLGANDAADAGADANVMAFLEVEFTTVRYMNSGATDGSETADVIVMSSTFGSGSVRGKFHNSAVPILNWEEAVMDSGDGEFGQSLAAMTKSTDTTQMALGDHPIAGALAGTTIDYLTAVGAETLGSSELSADTVAVGTGTGGAVDGLAMLFVTDTGGAVGEGSGVVDNVSPARRVSFPMTDATFDSLTDAGKELFVNSILWAAGIVDPPTLPDIPGVIGYWPLDGSAADASGKGVDGNVINADGVWVDDGGRSVYQSGNDSFIELGTLPVIGLNTDFTWSFWVNADETDNNNIVFGNRWGPDGVDFDPREFIKFTPRVFEWHVDAGGQNVPGENSMFIVGEWAHNLVVKTGTTLSYYRDGTEIATSEITAAPANAQPLYLGGQNGAEIFSGKFDEVAIFNRALSTDEVTDVYNRGLNGQTLTAGGPGPEGPLPSLTNIGIQASGAFGITVPDGMTADIEYSTDLIDWEVIATGITGSVEETDAARMAAPAGYYRAKQ